MQLLASVLVVVLLVGLSACGEDTVEGHPDLKLGPVVYIIRFESGEATGVDLKIIAIEGSKAKFKRAKDGQISWVDFKKVATYSLK